MAKLNKKQIDNLKSSSKKLTLWDDNPRGLGVKISSTGTKTFILKYRNLEGRQRKLKIGAYGVLTLDEARKRAKEKLSEVSAGKDPSGERQEIRRSPTMKDLFEKYLEEHSQVRNKPNTHRSNMAMVNNYLIPALGKYKAQSIVRKDIYALQQKLAQKSKSVANNAISILSKAFNLAEIWGIRPDNSNPCRHVQKFPTKPKQRFFTKEEFNKLGEVLNFMEKAQLELPSALLALRLLMYTGCRLNEILQLKWEYVSFENKCFRLPDSKTGAKTVYYSNAVDNLDNDSIFAVLAECIRQAKKSRQVILVTHNPNLAVGADAEQIIFVKLEKAENYKFSYETGSIENPRINDKIVLVLEGSQPAFIKRRLKYEI